MPPRSDEEVRVEIVAKMLKERGITRAEPEAIRLLAAALERENRLKG